MRGVVLLGERALEARAFPDPRPGPGEIVRLDEAVDAYRLFDTPSAG